jgi:hypothetical protein
MAGDGDEASCDSARRSAAMRSDDHAVRKSAWSRFSADNVLTLRLHFNPFCQNFSSRSRLQPSECAPREVAAPQSFPGREYYFLGGASEMM